MVTTREPTSQQASWSLHCRTIMSSPLPRLGKTRRAPLLGHSYASFPLRREEDRTSWSPTRLPPVDLSKQTHDRIIREINREHKSIPDDNSLLSSMAARLAMVERELLAAKREIIEKEDKIQSLEERLAAEQAEAASHRTSTAANTGSLPDLQTKCAKLQKQVKEMEKFLNDYGMIWVGEEAGQQQDSSHTHLSPSSSSPSLWHPDSSITNTDQSNSSPPHIDFDKLVSNIQQLNILAGEDTSVICKNVGGASSLKKTESVPLTLYKNGLVMFQGPFRPYSDPSTRTCIQDLLDGYFPLELQSRYPDGIPFKLSDLRSHDYHHISISTVLFPGKGRTLQDTPTHHEPSYSVNIPSALPSIIRHPQHEEPLSLDRFLSRIPKNVITNGKVVDVRDELIQTLKGGTPNTITPTCTPFTDNLDGPGSLSVNLRIRFPNEQTMILTMAATDTIGQLKSEINKTRSHDKLSHDYIIRGGFPCKVLSDVTRTLQEYDLFPSCNVFIQ